MVSEQTQPQAQTEQTEVREDIAYFSGEYFSAVCHIIALQFSDAPETSWPAEKEEFAERCTYLMRQHCPQAYAFYLQQFGAENILPSGTLDIILQNVRLQKPTFLGGRADGGIIIARR
jgi:hypothetical protein